MSMKVDISHVSSVVKIWRWVIVWECTEDMSIKLDISHVSNVVKIWRNSVYSLRVHIRNVHEGRYFPCV